MITVAFNYYNFNNGLVLMFLLVGEPIKKVFIYICCSSKTVFHTTRTQIHYIQLFRDILSYFVYEQKKQHVVNNYNN